MPYAINSWPAVLSLGTDDRLTCEAPLRSLPGKRLVCRGSWQNRPVVAKIFLDPVHASRHCNREKKGVEALQKAGITTPPLLFSGKVENQAPVLIFAELPTPQTGQQVWQQTTTDGQRIARLREFLSLLAEHHQAGLWQKDLHLNNFLLSDQVWHTIDGDAVESSQLGTPLGLNTSLSNLALFFAQLAPHFDHLIHDALSAYTAPRGIDTDKIEPLLTTQLAIARTKRRHNYVSKCYRSCSEFVRVKERGQIAIYRRDSDPERIRQLLADPDHLIAQGEMLKNGNSATVVRVPHPQNDWVIKRYNYKSIWHALKRCLRPSRAWISWGNSHRLKISAIATPKAIAVIEKRLGPFRLGAYFICENVCAANALEYFTEHRTEAVCDDPAAQNIATLFEQFHKLGIHHGDCKATNFLIHQQQPWVIDLDAMKEFSTRPAFLRRYTTDRKRFLLNWQKHPRLQGWFKQRLPE